MLIKFIDHKDKTLWVNPAYIKSVKEKGKDKAQVEVSGWPLALVVNGDADEIAGLINLAAQEAMLLGQMGGASPGTPSTAQLADQQEQANASQAAIIGSVVIGG